MSRRMQRKPLKKAKKKKLALMPVEATPRPEPKPELQTKPPSALAEKATTGNWWQRLTVDAKILGSLAILSLIGIFFVPEVRHALGRPPEGPPPTETPKPPEGKEKRKEPPTGAEGEKEDKPIEPKFRLIPMPDNKKRKPETRQAENGPSGRSGVVIERTMEPGGRGAVAAAAKGIHPVPYVSQADAEKHLVYRVEPKFPDVKITKLPANVNTRVPEGSAEVFIFIKKDGTVEIEDVRESDRGLGAAAVKAVEQWRFEPFLVDGKPAAVRTMFILSAEKPNGQPEILPKPKN